MQFSDRRDLSIRLSLIQFGAVLGFSALAIAFWVLQIAQHQQFDETAANNHQRTVSLRAPRGMVFDRTGRVLVQNRYAFNILLVREQTDDVQASLMRVAALTGADDRALSEIVRQHAHEPGYRPIALIEDASLAQVAAVDARRLEFPEIMIDQVPTRYYPEHELGAHLFGYVGAITDAQLSQAAYDGLSGGAVVGQAGLELSYDRRLMGRDGVRRVVVNSVGREIDTLGETPAEEGARTMLTIDYDLQRAAEEAFHAAGFWGSFVMLDPRSGEVLSYVSLPGYDPNAFAVGIDRTAWGALNADGLNPLQNRPIQGRYSPGSLFKIAVAIAALEEGVVTPSFTVYCPGGATFYGRYFRCHLAGGHGTVDMREAIEKSCNVYFYTLGNMVGIDAMHTWATALGLGVSTGIDLPNEVTGLMPSTEWKLARTGERWYLGETISVAIGQGQVSVTPLSLAVMMATVANGGIRHVPHVLKAIDDGAGWRPAGPGQPAAELKLRPSTIAVVQDGLWRVVNGQGTGGRARLEGRDVAGKTGTAQVISRRGREQAGDTERDLRDHGWFVFFAPKDNPQVAGVVLAEHAEHGYLAAPIAKHVIATYFAKAEGLPLPALPGSAPGAPAATIATN